MQESGMRGKIIGNLIVEVCRVHAPSLHINYETTWCRYCRKWRWYQQPETSHPFFEVWLQCSPGNAFF